MIGDEVWGADWRWYFSNGIDMKLLEEKCKLKKAGAAINPEMSAQTTERAGCAIIIHRRLWNVINDVRPINGRLMKAELGTTPKMIVFSIYAPQACLETEIKHECLYLSKTSNIFEFSDSQI